MLMKKLRKGEIVMKKTMKKLISVLCTGTLLLGTAASIGGCAGSGSTQDANGGGDEKINDSKTQLEVHNFDGGYGDNWLYAVKARFEEAYKDVSFEDGKKGVQVIITPANKKKGDALASIISTSKYEVYFTEYANYYSLVNNGYVEDITDVVTAALEGEQRSIQDKLSQEQKNFYGILGEDGQPHYYGVPHYASYASNLIFNVDLFEENGYYLAAQPSGDTPEDYFVSKNNPEKSPGPDGQSGTWDDGLPRTYDEFFLLCDFIASDGVTPLIFSGADHGQYLNLLDAALAVEQNGYEQTMLNYTLDGSATNLCKIKNGKLTKDPSPTQITAQNGYELARQESKYYGTEFIRRIVSNSAYHFSESLLSSFSHMDAQNKFIVSRNDSDKVAMLVDGIWWENEADATFATMASKNGEQYSRANSNYSVMPFPKATEKDANNALAGDKLHTLYDESFSLCFMKKGLTGGKREAAAEFIRFCNTDASLVEFTETTSTYKALNYSLTEEEKGRLTAFGKSVSNLRDSSQVVYPCAPNDTFLNHVTFFETDTLWTSTILNGITQNYPSQVFMKDAISAADYFDGMYHYFKQNWGAL